ncbi:hypothetical protein MTR67_002384 [Solanum verrucosum]|uniref:DUF4216 domain-containing protein n=1 Tax=Solanum verrucosum TaxID=315347 RepID=A0AAF0PQ08_SOLVR|nr:hypothetical protein MTR67_002384 [Solanum verrucosum]
MRHPADSMAWKSFDELYPSFAAEPRNVQLGLASDGFQSFRNSKTSHSIWPVVLIPYNLPLWLCMKQENFILSLLIPSPNGPRDAIDTYLQPLIEDFKELWEVGIETYDASARKNFKLHASLLWTINDFPAYGNLFGWSTKGNLACPCCNKDTSSTRLSNGKKQCYMGHRRYLPHNHKWRNEKKSFDGTEERRPPPQMHSEGYIANECVTLCSREFAQTYENARHLSDVEWNRQFIEWFKDRVAQFHKRDSSRIMEDFLSLSCGPTQYSTHSNGYIVNEYRFHVEYYDKKLRTQNCGVVVLGENDKDSENLDYYGVLTDVIELQFVMDRRVTLFRCNWFDVYDEIKGVKKDEYDFVSANPDRFLKTNEPFVLADQASQVFYAKDNSNKGWQVVRKTQPRDSYEIVEQMDDDIVELGSPSQKKRKRTNEVKFKMKPLKTENEADSFMKRTIRYTFVAPGAIGKGRGRGLKSLAENYASQSNDLVNHYIQEIETGKGRGQGLTNSTLFTSQGMTTIPKNSIDLDKENKQTNPSAHALTNLGKGRGQGITNSTLFTSQRMPTIPKNSIDFDKENKQINPSTHASTNLGKGRGQGITNSTLFTSQGMSTLPKNSIDLEKENKQTNPSAHASTNLGKGRGQGITNSTLFTSQGMPMIPKNSINLEKENKQTNPSPHASTNLSSIGKGRGQGHKGSTLFTSQGMGMKHNNNMTSESEVGCINKSALYANQHTKTPSKRTRVNSTMLSSQEMQIMDKMIFVKEDMQTIDQVMEHSQTTEKANLFERLFIKRVGDGNPPALATIFFETRKKDNKLVEPEAIEKHAHLEGTVHEDPSLSSIEIVEKCCGPQTRSHVFGFGGGVKAKYLKGGTSSKAELLSALRSIRDDNKFLNEENKSLNEETNSLNDRLSTLKDEMKAIMKLKEFFDAQQSDVPPTTSFVSTE